MRTKQLYTRPRAKRGTVNGRSQKIKHILIPEDTFQELTSFKQAYELKFGQKVSWDQMFRRWMGFSRIQSDVKVEMVQVLLKKNEEPAEQPTPPEG